MASVVYQGLQSCLEPQLTESVVITPKLLSSKPKPDPVSSNGWGFFNVLEKPPSEKVENEEVYVHPMVKRSASALSTMSLEMCTESLGTETGSDVSESGDEFPWEEKERFGGLPPRSKHLRFDRKMVSHRRGGGGRNSNFPPPLTSINGSGGTVRVRPHREGGRLVIKAVSLSDCGTKFEAERTNGRLSLFLLRDRRVNVETGRAKMKNEEGCCDGDGEEEEEGGGGWSEVAGNRRKVGGKTKVRSPKRRFRLANSFDKSTGFGLTKCKDGRNGNKGIANWSLFRVVIS
ncbi:hypothetical protein SSX86_026864 [Deinandra increscens subsp. villosa]|uniref:FAF domain-containing protein n=1 Tax=Deinandra increscens subsp. villosa TaxID=3103831 RepID=A0AAP0CM69_9ASTR